MSGDVGAQPSASGNVREGASAREGWTRRFVAAPPRLEEAAALYRSMGYEVRLERVPLPELREDCAGCPLARGLLRVIYTRRRE